MSEPDRILSVAGLEVRYGAALALSGVTLDLTEGSVLAVLGANGAGKSTLARACSGLVPPVAGTIRFAGQDVTGWSADRRRRGGLVYLPEGRGIFPNLSVFENLRVAVRLKEDKAAALDKAFTLFPVLGQRKRQRAGSLSGGEQQMLSLARALAVDPKLVIVDEPSLGLAPKLVDMVFETLEDAKRSGMTFIIIEQFAHKALALADRCIILRRGRMTWNGDAVAAAGHLAEHYFGDETDVGEPAGEASSAAG
jgi:branched-chain amino acid transport system ATP-binding protein